MACFVIWRPNPKQGLVFLEAGQDDKGHRAVMWYVRRGLPSLPGWTYAFCCSLTHV